MILCSLFTLLLSICGSHAFAPGIGSNHRQTAATSLKVRFFLAALFLLLGGTALLDLFRQPRQARVRGTTSSSRDGGKKWERRVPANATMAVSFLQCHRPKGGEEAFGATKRLKGNYVLTVNRWSRL